jgi:hypothetical protein
VFLKLYNSASRASLIPSPSGDSPMRFYTGHHLKSPPLLVCNIHPSFSCLVTAESDTDASEGFPWLAHRVTVLPQTFCSDYAFNDVRDHVAQSEGGLGYLCRLKLLLFRQVYCASPGALDESEQYCHPQHLCLRSCVNKMVMRSRRLGSESSIVSYVSWTNRSRIYLTYRRISSTKLLKAVEHRNGVVVCDVWIR